MMSALLHRYYFFLTLLFLAVSSIPCWSRTSEDTVSVNAKPGKFYIIPLPALAYNPAFGFIYGVAASGNILLGNPEDTRLSSGFLTATYSTKKQFIFTLKSNVYTKHDRWILNGDWRFFLSSQPTYGLGTGDQTSALVIGDEDNFGLGDYDDGVEEGELLKFNLFRFHQSAIRRITSGVYVGIGYQFDKYWDIEDVLLDLEADPPLITNHYAYSILHDFDPEGYVISGPTLNVMYDTRDNINYPFSGRYANLQFKASPTWLGSDQQSTSLWLEYRDYFSLSKKVPRNTIALWAYTNLTLSGQLPYMGLPALGWDQLGRSGRAYPQGRFRGEHLFYAEMEYRFRLPLIRKYPDLLGGVMFANTTSASALDQEVKLMQHFKPGAGVGLRIMIQKATRSNVTLDYGIGADGKGAFYFNMKEYF
jgi:hypothetical protein